MLITVWRTCSSSSITRLSSSRTSSFAGASRCLSPPAPEDASFARVSCGAFRRVAGRGRGGRKATTGHRQKKKMNPPKLTKHSRVRSPLHAGVHAPSPPLGWTWVCHFGKGATKNKTMLLLSRVRDRAVFVAFHDENEQKIAGLDLTTTRPYKKSKGINISRYLSLFIVWRGSAAPLLLTTSPTLPRSRQVSQARCPSILPLLHLSHTTRPQYLQWCRRR